MKNLSVRVMVTQLQYIANKLKDVAKERQEDVNKCDINTQEGRRHIMYDAITSMLLSIHDEGIFYDSLYSKENKMDEYAQKLAWSLSDEWDRRLLQNDLVCVSIMKDISDMFEGKKVDYDMAERLLDHMEDIDWVGRNEGNYWLKCIEKHNESIDLPSVDIRKEVK